MNLTTRGQINGNYLLKTPGMSEYMHEHYTVAHGLPLYLTNLLERFEQVKHRDKEDVTGIVYLDFPKAFDKVPHPRFFKELNCHGIGRKVLTGINTWLKDRKQGMDMRQVLRTEKAHQWNHKGSVLGSRLTFLRNRSKEVLT